MYTNQILLAEDDSTDAEFFRRALGRLDAPPELLWFKNGQEVLDGLTGGEEAADLPRVAILDIKMPGMSGLEVLDKLKHNPRTKDLPIIIMSSSDEPQDIAKAYECGANGYLVKPNRFQELRELVHSINSFWIKTNRLRPMPGG